MKIRKRIRNTSFFLALILVFSLLTVTSTVRANRLEREKRASLQQAICEFDEYISSIDSSLSKGIYATTPPMILSLSTQVWRLSDNAKIMLSLLPNENIDMSQANKFLSQLGELMMSLNRRAANGEKLTEKDVKLLSALLEKARALHASADALRDGAFDGTVELIAQTGNISVKNADDIKPLSSSLEQAAQTVTDFPSLIYDGPFSDHLDSKTAAYLNGKKEISESEAREICAKITGAQLQDCIFSSMDSGTVESYVFTVSKSTVAVTKKGGYLSYIISPEFAGENTLSYEQARDRAEDYLEKIGYENMVDTYHSESDGICTVNFAFEENGVRCYPDLIKVSVSMADGRVMSVDARNYLLSHQNRNLTEADFSSFKSAEEKISPLLHIKSTRCAVIPTDSGNEKACYEFHCADSQGQEVLVYIDKDTLNEADILLLTYSDNGVLTK